MRAFFIKGEKGWDIEIDYAKFKHSSMKQITKGQWRSRQRVSLII